MRQIPLQANRGFALVDDEDYDKVVARGPWHLNGNRRNQRYARNNQGEMMHWFILPCEKGLEVDHEDGDGLNNQKYNLRRATHRQNIINGHERRMTRGLHGQVS